MVIFFIGCKKSNIGEYPDFKGFWIGESSGTRYEIEVKNNGKSTYEEFRQNSDVWYKGRLIVEDNELKIGWKKLKINQFPTQNSEGFKIMVLDDIEYYSN